ncbi:MAG: histidine kinase [Halobacteriaceae archaeon]
MSLREFVAAREADPVSLVVANRTEPRPLYRLLERTFRDQSVDVSEADLPDVDDDVVLLVADGEVVASSPLSALSEAILLVNSDLYVTGTRDLPAVDLPDVLAGLADTPFHLRGFPASNREKLLLVVSRYVERLAWVAGDGRIRSSFQHLSRLSDERGTRRVYERLADSVDVHLYGVPDRLPPRELGATVHAGYDEEFRRSWFVVFTPGPEADVDPAALVAVEERPGEWDGFWTRRPGLVADVNRYVEANL